MEEEIENKLDEEVSVLEFELDSDQIDELANSLAKLKEHKKNIRFEIDDEYELSIHHAESEFEDMPSYEEDSE